MHSKLDAHNRFAEVGKHPSRLQRTTFNRESVAPTELTALAHSLSPGYFCIRNNGKKETQKGGNGLPVDFYLQATVFEKT